MPPPNALRTLLASAINSFDPTSIDSTGAPNPLLRQNITVSNPRVISATLTPAATAALNTRAPSQCAGNPAARAPAQISSSTVTGVTVPPAMLCEFSTQISPVGAR